MNSSPAAGGCYREIFSLAIIVRGRGSQRAIIVSFTRLEGFRAIFEGI